MPASSLEPGGSVARNHDDPYYGAGSVHGLAGENGRLLQTISLVKSPRATFRERVDVLTIEC